jgi:hypothetical protein
MSPADGQRRDAFPQGLPCGAWPRPPTRTKGRAQKTGKAHRCGIPFSHLPGRTVIRGQHNHGAGRDLNVYVNFRQGKEISGGRILRLLSLLRYDCHLLATERSSSIRVMQ